MPYQTRNDYVLQEQLAEGQGPTPSFDPCYGCMKDREFNGLCHDCPLHLIRQVEEQISQDIKGG